MASRATGETTVAAPALAKFRDVSYLAWAAGGGMGGAEPNLRLNVRRGVSSASDGRKLPPLDETSRQALALTAHNDQLFISWTGADGIGKLNLASSGDGETFSNKQTLNDTSLGGPALVGYKAFPDDSLNSQTFLVRAWSGGGGLGGGPPDGRVNVAWSLDGRTWPDENRLVLPHKSIAAPALAAMDVPNIDAFRLGTLWLGWTDGLHIFVTHCFGLNFGQLELDSHRERVQSGGRDETTFTSPSLNCGGNGPRLAWPGTDGAHKINFMRCINSVGPFGERKTLPSEFASSAVTIDAHEGISAYRGTDNVGQIFVGTPVP